MSFSSGSFSLAEPDVVTGTTISSSWANSVLGDIADNGLTFCVLKNGTQTITANIPMSSFKFTGLGAGSSAADSATIGGTETLTNKTLTSPTINTPTIAGGTHTALTGLGIRSTGSGAFDLTLANTENLAAGRTLTIKVNDAARTVDLAGNLTLAAALVTSGANSLTLTTTASTNVTLPTSGTLGYLGLPQNSQSDAYTTVLADAGKHIIHPAADNNPRTFTIDSNANVAYPVGTAITFVNEINVLTIAITSDTMKLAGPGTTGSRSLAANGVATALKVSSTGWIISGTGLT